MRIMMAEKRMIRVTMLQRENKNTWASYRQPKVDLTTAAELH